MNQFPKIAVIVLNHNHKEDLLNCLNSLFRIDYPNFEVIVVDNNSQDGALEAARLSYPKVSYIKNQENLGFAKGNNIGIRYALERMADWVVLLNNDTKVKKDFLTKLAEAVENDPKVGIASPIIMKNDGPEVWFSGGEIDWIRMKTVHFCDSDGTKDSSFITGCAMMISSEVFKKIGLLDEKFFLYWEDADFTYRTRKAGFSTVVVPGSIVYHYERSQDKPDNKIYWLVFSGLLFFSKNTPFRFKLWMRAFLSVRKLKNWIDVNYSKDNRIALVVNKAYKDFKNAQKIR